MNSKLVTRGKIIGKKKDAKKNHIQNHDATWAWLMLAPNLTGFLLFMLGPVVMTFVISLTEYDLIDPMKFVGFHNYMKLFQDPIIGETLINTLVYTVIVVPIGMCISLGLAVLLDQKIALRRFYRAAYFLPSITSMVAVSVVWQWIYNPEFGILNYLLSFFRIPPLKWLSSSNTSLVSISIVGIWKNAGYNMMLFLSGLQGISTSYYEASELDGANKWEQFVHVTLPMMRPTISFVFIMSIISSFQVFDAVNLMTQGGPGRSSSVLVHYLYQNAFQYFNMGYACAIAYLLFGIVLLITIINMMNDKKLREIY
ncbi:sugar ABC transporter permease [Muricomes intestini]|jgi:multiple sugar transport system permease protein|uniref:carbohydrate ABC transporter permease n=1 Tax=Muricomes intestini TaxID=1796634 RepID=UPI002FE1195A